MKLFKDCLEDNGISDKAGLLKGHQGQVNCVEADFKGKLVVTGANDATVAVWDGIQGIRIRWSGAMVSAVSALVMSGNGEDLITGHKTGEVIVNDFEEIRPKFTLYGHRLRVTSLKFLNLESLISSSWDGTIRIWDLISQTQQNQLESDSSFVNTLCLHNTLLISGSDSSYLHFWNLASCSKSQKATPSSTLCISIHPKSNLILSGHSSGDLVFWDLSKASLKSSTKAHNKSVTSIKILPLQSQFLSSSLDGFLILWDSQTQSPQKSFNIRSGITCMATNKYSNKVYIGTSNSKVGVLDYTENTENFKFFNGHTCIVHRCVWIKKGECLITASFDGSIHLWDLINSKLVYTFMQEDTKVIDLAINSSNTYIAAGCSNKNFYIWDLNSLQIINKARTSCNPYKILHFSETHLVSQNTYSIIYWNIQAEPIEIHKHPKGVITNCAVKAPFIAVCVESKYFAIIKFPKN